ncbi:Sel1 repeat protein [Rubripirellula tenax]|uniref:Sel1 repeat protein n=1 Tax=Rubripirellula tenax TaxID=2528015 RepID=A0A5C6ERM0_9BACT|nr:tetratricopeptide repeat protein [Rubripirellula tenax]TWU50960.1 Sel1 repeat protein [Rubripirellula tenax]
MRTNYFQIFAVGLLLVAGCPRPMVDSQAHQLVISDPKGERLGEHLAAKSDAMMRESEPHDSGSHELIVSDWSAPEVDVQSAYLRGKQSLSVSNFDEAFHHFLFAAEKGHAESQFAVAMMFHHGQGTNTDGQKSLLYCQAAADQNLSQAQYLLAKFYRQGIYVPANDAVAFRLFDASAGQGLAQAQVSLGLCYALGVGTEMDAIKARELLEKAHKLGFDLAQTRTALVQDAIELRDYPIKKIQQHQATFEQLRKSIDPETEFYQSDNGIYRPYENSILSRQEREYDALFADLMRSKPDRDRKITLIVATMGILDELLGDSD